MFRLLVQLMLKSDSSILKWFELLAKSGSHSHCSLQQDIVWKEMDKIASNPILPPFPFPEKWVEVSLQQQLSGDLKWLVPGTTEMEDLIRAYCPHGHPHGHQTVVNGSNLEQVSKSQELQPNELDWDGDDGEEFESLELDPAWAARFSKTIKKMKQKVHKAKRRADWKKK